LNDEPHEKGRGDENHQPAHPFRHPPVSSGRSRLPVPPPEFAFRIGDSRSVSGHRVASTVLSDMYCILEGYAFGLHGAVPECTPA